MVHRGTCISPLDTCGRILDMPSSPPIDTPKRKLNRAERRIVLPTLQASGLTQDQMAAKCGVSRSTIVNDLNDLHPVELETGQHLKSLIGEITKTLPIEKRAETYVDLATNDKNGGIRLSALMRIDDLDGIVTEKERIRARTAEPAAPVALFILPQSERPQDIDGWSHNGNYVNSSTTIGSGQRAGFIKS